VRFAAGTVEDLLKDPPADRPDVLILDPPRPGLSPKAMKNVLGLGVPKVVYVSCNPVSLAHDLGRFIAHRYEVKELAPFDFFPHTPHLETVAVLAR
jgi:23S rRNA (uracil1939-C5)-methyltransferase